MKWSNICSLLDLIGYCIEFEKYTTTVVPTKSDSDAMFC